MAPQQPFHLQDENCIVWRYLSSEVKVQFLPYSAKLCKPCRSILVSISSVRRATSGAGPGPGEERRGQDGTGQERTGEGQGFVAAGLAPRSCWQCKLQEPGGCCNSHQVLAHWRVTGGLWMSCVPSSSSQALLPFFRHGKRFLTASPSLCRQASLQSLQEQTEF